jgi:hypothetical protein
MRLPKRLVYFVPMQLCTTCSMADRSLVSMLNDMDSATYRETQQQEQQYVRGSERCNK